MIDFFNHLVDSIPSLLYNPDPRINEAWVQVALAAAALAAQLFGSSKSAQARKRQKESLDRKRRDIESQMASEMSKDYLDTDAAQSSLKKLREMYADNLKKLEGNGVKEGLTEEAKVTAANGMNKTYADAVSQIAAQGTAYKENQKRFYQSKLDNIDGMIYGNMAEDAGKWTQFGDNVANAAGVAMQAYGAGAFSKGSSVASSDISKTGVDSSLDSTASKANKSDLFKYGR